MVECCLGLRTGGVWGGGSVGQGAMHREPLLGVPEQIQGHSNGEEKMTCYDSHGYTEARKKGVKVNEGGVVVVQGAETGLLRRTDRSKFTQAYLNPNLCFSLSLFTWTTTISCGVACLWGHQAHRQ